MRLIKMLLVGFATLFIAITLFSLIIPSKVNVSRTIQINATTSKVYTQIANLRNWKNWQPMFASDSSVITFSTTPLGNNTACDIIYKNRQVHIATTAIDSTSIKFLLQSKGENNIENEISITPVNNQNTVQVEWKALTKLHWYPWDKFYGIFADRITGPGYKESLNSLKKFVESEP